MSAAAAAADAADADQSLARETETMDRRLDRLTQATKHRRVPPLNPVDAAVGSLVGAWRSSTRASCSSLSSRSDSVLSQTCS